MMVAIHSGGVFYGYYDRQTATATLQEAGGFRTGNKRRDGRLRHAGTVSQFGDGAGTHAGANPVTRLDARHQEQFPEPLALRGEKRLYL
jgi:hypothetical protein